MGYATRFAVIQVGIVGGYHRDIIRYVKNALIFPSKPSQAPIRS